MKKTISLLALLLLFSIEIQAQVTNVLNNFYTVWVKPAIPIIGGLVLIGGWHKTFYHVGSINIEPKLYGYAPWGIMIPSISPAGNGHSITVVGTTLIRSLITYFRQKLFISISKGKSWNQFPGSKH